jgi:phosphate starvation-inducible membrane PsiE
MKRLKKEFKRLVKLLLAAVLKTILVEFGNYLLSYERRDTVTLFDQHIVTDKDIANYIAKI